MAKSLKATIIFLLTKQCFLVNYYCLATSLHLGTILRVRDVGSYLAGGMLKQDVMLGFVKSSSVTHSNIYNIINCVLAAHFLLFINSQKSSSGLFNS